MFKDCKMRIGDLLSVDLEGIECPILGIPFLT